MEHPSQIQHTSIEPPPIAVPSFKQSLRDTYIIHFDSLHTQADVHLERADGGGFEIPRIDLTLDAEIPDIDQDTFDDLAQNAKETCPVSKALAGPEIALDATLKS